MKVFGRHDDGTVIDLSETPHGSRFSLMIAESRRFFTDTQIEEMILRQMEAEDFSLIADDVRIEGDEMWLDLPSFERIERGQGILQAFVYAAHAREIGLPPSEIIEDIVEAGWSSEEDAERIVSC